VPRRAQRRCGKLCQPAGPPGLPREGDIPGLDGNGASSTIDQHPDTIPSWGFPGPDGIFAPAPRRANPHPVRLRFPQRPCTSLPALPDTMRPISSDTDLVARWATAVALAGVAVALQWAMRPWVGTRIPFLLFLPVIVVAAARSGRVAGLFVVAAGLCNAIAWLAPAGRHWVAGPTDALSLLIYALLGVLLATLGARLHVTSARASAAEQRLVLAGEDTGIGIFDLDLATRTVYLSPALALLCRVDVSSGAARLEDVMAHMPPEVALEARAVVARKLSERATGYEREVRLQVPDGRERWLLLRVHIVWPGNRAVRMRGACIDVTERRAVDDLLGRTQAELGQQVADLHRLHELSSRLLDTRTLSEQLHMILVALADFHGARRGVLALFDAASGTLGIDCSTGFTPDAVARLMQTSGIDGACAICCARRERTVIADTAAPDIDPGLRALAGEEGFRAVHATPLIGQDGALIGALSIHLDLPHAPTERERTLADICARKAANFVERARAQAAYHDSQGRFQAVLDASAVPFVVLSPVREASSGQIVDFEWSYVNAAAAKALHHPVDTFATRRVLDVLPARWSGSDSFRQYVAVCENVETREFEVLMHHEGVAQWFRCVASPLRGSVALWFNDITARKNDERQLQEADRRKDEFLATLAHELRNPLAPIRQASAVSRLAQATEAQKRWSHEVIERQVRHMALLLDDLLDVSRITRGRLALRRGANTLAEMIEAAVETARPLVDARHHALEVVTPQARILMQADPLRVSQIVANLLTNAAKYTDPHGRIRLLAALDGDDVVIEVSDNGIGIAPESLPAVFDMFTQLRGTGDRASGLGIGLALTKGLVELHGGSIRVHSEGTGRGSVFTVRLPRGEAPAREAPTGGELEPRATSARRILVADDNRDAAESLAALLELEGHEVTLAYDGAEALLAFERVRPQVCLLDIGMPHRSGNEVAAEIRSSAGGGRPTLVAITGWGQDADRSQALAAGFDHHLTKPVDPAQLLRLIGEAHRGEPARA
jgi:signal transduction histidine kinase/ActR/RegA family two-component response regulator